MIPVIINRLKTIFAKSANYNFNKIRFGVAKVPTTLLCPYDVYDLIQLYHYETAFEKEGEPSPTGMRTEIIETIKTL